MEFAVYKNLTLKHMRCQLGVNNEIVGIKHCKAVFVLGCFIIIGEAQVLFQHLCSVCGIVGGFKRKHGSPA